MSDYNERLTQRLADTNAAAVIDPARLATEIMLFAERACIDEEIIRMQSHLAQLAEILESGGAEGGAVGRKLDFLVQEMNREANTMGSKSNDLEITKCVVDLKSEIEKIREQVQNIE